VTALRAAASTLIRPVMDGPLRAATVVAATPMGAYLLLDDGSDVVPLLTADALLLPTAVRVGSGAAGAPLPLRAGQQATVGAGAIRAPGLRVDIARTFRPARVRPVGDRRSVPTLAGGDLRGRIGLGPGLTPEADDEFAGWLLVGWALGATHPDLRPELHRTTALSASLLRAAARGHAVPRVVAYVDAVVSGHLEEGSRLRAGVAAIGHTSGPAVLRGIDAALVAARQAGLPRHDHPRHEHPSSHHPHRDDLRHDNPSSDHPQHDLPPVRERTSA
jgi:hypothetical protein